METVKQKKNYPTAVAKPKRGLTPNEVFYRRKKLTG